MAQRYGGKFSPDGAPKEAAPPARRLFQGRRRTRVGGRVNLLFLAPLPLIWKAFGSEPVVMAQYLAALGLLLLAAWLTREGLRAQEAYEARKVARRPAIPRKLMASAATALGLGLAGLAGHGPLDAAIFAVLGGLLHLFAFGPDPLRDKGMEGIDTFQTDRVARAVEEAEKHLNAMAETIARTGDRALQRRVETFSEAVRELFRTVENDPRDLTAARKYLTVYLRGARDATTKFADFNAHTPDSDARADYEQLLDDLTANFAGLTRQLLQDDRSDLTVEIEVLRDRLEREGVRLPQE